MNKTFIDKDGTKIIRFVPFNQITPITGIWENDKYYQREYSKWLIKLNSWLSRRNADLLRFG